MYSISFALACQTPPDLPRFSSPLCLSFYVFERESRVLNCEPWYVTVFLGEYLDRASDKIITGTIILMATESPIRLLEGTEKWPPRKQSNSYGSSSSAKLAIEDFSLFLKERKFQSLEKDMIPSRSESAPPSMEGSIAAIENIFSLKNSTWSLDLHPGPSNRNCETDADLPFPYHGSDVILDRRFSRPLNSESRRLFHRLGSTGNDRNMIPHANIPMNTLPSHEEESEDDKSSERSASASVDKSASLDFHNDLFNSTQEDTGQTPSPSQDQYGRKSMGGKIVDTNSHVLHNHSVSDGIDASRLDHMRQVSQQDPLTGGVLSLSLDDESGVVLRPPFDGRNFTAGKVDLKDDASTAGVGDALNLNHNKFNKEQHIPQNYTSQTAAALPESNISRVPGPFSQMIYPGTTHPYGSLNQFHYGSSSVSTGEVQPTHQSSGFTPPFYTPPAPTPFMTPQSTFYQNMQPSGYFTPQYSMGGYNINTALLPSYLSGYPSQGTFPLAFDSASFPNPGVSDGGNAHAYDMQNLPKYYGQVGVTMQLPSVDPYHMQYFQQQLRNSYGAYGQFNHQAPRNDATVSQVSSRDFKKGATLTGFPNDLKSPHSFSIGYNSFNTGNRFQFPSASIGSPVVSLKPAVGPNFSGGRNSMINHTFHGNASKTYGLQNQTWNGMSSNSFLEELKLGQGQRFELSDIVGHIAEFSVDQHGSRFIQQKLEHCSLEEKESVFKEVVPHASKLMTDVFGNYVIQKLFEYGSLGQKEDLANQLEGQILPLSLQMYGCRVIQKAFEVIDLAQKVRLAKELDGHVMKCVRDQNGNHVIQKCIESIPADNIHFIISSFRGQVATLSMHPYGCRVIQRVLEHCNDELQTQFIVSEILDSVCALAQDQYGNYVTQHVLARGIPRERSEIIEKLSGSIVQLSQHKFASNVIEKCLEYGDSVSRDLLIKEIVGHGDKNDNILVMMKDQYANYVIQKILQKCTSDQRELLLGVIRNHLTALKKYTYGKHIATRLEQAYGEEIQSSEP